MDPQYPPNSMEITGFYKGKFATPKLPSTAFVHYQSQNKAIHLPLSKPNVRIGPVQNLRASRRPLVAGLNISQEAKWSVSRSKISQTSAGCKTHPSNAQLLDGTQYASLLSTNSLESPLIICLVFFFCRITLSLITSGSRQMLAIRAITAIQILHHSCVVHLYFYKGYLYYQNILSLLLEHPH